MPMKPRKGESQSDFMGRCVPEMMGDGKRENEQAVAACLSIWRETGHEAPPPPKKALTKQIDIEPEDDETQDEFLERCTEAGNDESECELVWGERRIVGVVHKTHTSDAPGVEFILSDESPDRLGDIIVADGWDIRQFNRNPVALFNHDPNAPIGKWKNVGIAKGGKELRGHLELAPKGTSPRIDEIRALVEHGILRAVSVGFRAIEHEGLRTGGIMFKKAELVECSLVSVPANPNALAVMKQLKISEGTQALIFAKSGDKGSRALSRGSTGKSAAHLPRNRKAPTMGPLAQRIQEAEQRGVQLRDKLTENLKNLDENDVTDVNLTENKELRKQIADNDEYLDALRESEKSLAITSSPTPQLPALPNGGNGGGNVIEGEIVTHEFRGPTRSIADFNQQRPFAMAGRRLRPLDFLAKAVTVQILHHATRGARTMADVLRETYGDNEPVRALLTVISKASVSPAQMTVAGWAAELVQQTWADFLESLRPVSIFPQLAGKGASFTFGRNGVINLPMRSSTPTIAGSFVGEGAPIPVRRGAFATAQITPKKLAVISTFTREISEHSTPAIEGLIRESIVQDTAVAIDTILLDANAATAIRPPGLRNGVSGLTPTAGGGLAAFIGDIKQLVSALINASLGNLRSPVWLMSPADVVAASLLTTANGDMPFKEELGRGTLLGYPVIQSTSVTADTLYLIDAADFATANGEEMRFDISDQALIHEEDTTPLSIATGSPATVASPLRSLWQTDTIGIRMIQSLNWVMRRTGMVQFVTGLTWN